VAIARALAMDPSVIVFDEPTSALDPIMSREVAAMIQRLNADNVTMICVTHDLQLARHLHERIVFLDQGVVRAEDSFDNLAKCDDPQVRAFFRNEVKAE
jgi:polar amino acid transport system ATP-binding protein